MSLRGVSYTAALSWDFAVFTYLPSYDSAMSPTPPSFDSVVSTSPISLDLAVSTAWEEPTGYRTYQVPNLSDTEPFRLQAHLILNLS